VEQVAGATCPTHACHVRCDANFSIKKLLKGAPSRWMTFSQNCWSQ